MDEEVKEVNNTEVNVSEDAQTDKSLEDELSLEAPKANEVETVESLKARLAKAEEERENYKKGMLKYKSKTKGEVVDEDEDEDEEVDVKGVATQAATQVIEKANEKSAIAQFTNKYPALKDPKAWNEVLLNYNPKNGKGSVDDIQKDLEAALMLAKHYGGGKVAEKEISLNEYASVSRAGSNAYHDEGSTVKESTLSMAREFKHDPEKVKNESDYLTAEIQL